MPAFSFSHLSIFTITASVLFLAPLQIQSQTIHITGRVIDSINREPVPGATVKWNDGMPAATTTTTTDAQGFFTLSGPVTALAMDSTSLIHFFPPYLSAGHFRFATKKSPQTVTVTFFNTQGKTLSTLKYKFTRVGWQDLIITPEMNGLFLGFVAVQSESETYCFKVLHQKNPILLSTAAFLTKTRKVTARLVAGIVNVSQPQLNPGSAVATSDSMNVGDIVLGYPMRQTIGVGARMPWGTTTLFDGSQGRTDATAELQLKWKDWPRFSTPSPIMFRIARDPQFLSDTNHVTLQSCCNTNWGYDDIQATVGLFQDAQIHVEFIGMGAYDTPAYDPVTPNANATDPFAAGQPGYINSGVYIASRYEIQIQSWSTTSTSIPGTHDMGAIVDQFTPTANQNKANGTWQAFDITYRSARFTGSTMTTAPYMTVWWNGTMVHNNLLLGAGASGLTNHSGEEHFGSKLVWT